LGASPGRGHAAKRRQIVSDPIEWMGLQKIKSYEHRHYRKGYKKDNLLFK
jgi:hypothetical protein